MSYSLQTVMALSRMVKDSSLAVMPALSISWKIANTTLMSILRWAAQAASSALYELMSGATWNSDSYSWNTAKGRSGKNSLPAASTTASSTRRGTGGVLATGTGAAAAPSPPSKALLLSAARSTLAIRTLSTSA